MSIYGIVGQSGQYICREWEKPPESIEMQTFSPSPDAIAQEGGTWGYSADTIRGERDKLLSQCDFTQLPDAPISAEVKLDRAAYRQALRDIPLQPGFPNSVVWPTPPE